MLVSALLLVGLAMTESRTAWINVALLVSAATIWRRLLPSARFLYALLGLGIFFLVCVLVLPLIQALYNDGVALGFRSPVGDPRWTAWMMFLKAAAHHRLGANRACAVSNDGRENCARGELFAGAQHGD